MSEDAVVLDASALLALLFHEAGADKVAARLDDCCMSAVNFSEVIGKLVDRGDDIDQAIADLVDFDIVVVPFDRAQAEASGKLRAKTREAGLSLGDRACLALAMARGTRALTGDRAWLRVMDGVSVEVELIR